LAVAGGRAAKGYGMKKKLERIADAKSDKDIIDLEKI